MKTREHYLVCGSIEEAVHTIERLTNKGYRIKDKVLGHHPTLGGWIKVIYEWDDEDED